jgi:hypothetical protein
MRLHCGLADTSERAISALDSTPAIWRTTSILAGGQPFDLLRSRDPAAAGRGHQPLLQFRVQGGHIPWAADRKAPGDRFGVRVLGEERAGARVEGGQQRFVVGIGGQDRDLGAGMLGVDPRGDRHPVAAGHAQIDQQHVRFVLGDQSIASAPSAAAPTTSISGSRPSRVTSPSRTTAWLSASTTRRGVMPAPPDVPPSVLPRSGGQPTAEQFGALAHPAQTVAAGSEGAGGLPCRSSTATSIWSAEKVRMT